MKYNFVYKTTNNINGKFYYGVHSTNDLDDGYMGSGRLITEAINKYGKSNFTRTIIQYFSNKEDAYAYESEIVTSELVKDHNCYNIALGGSGGDTYAGFTDEQRKETGKRISKALKGRKHGPMTEEHKQKLRGPFSEEHKQNLKGPKSSEHCKNIGKVNKDTRYMNNGVINKRVKFYDIDKYLENGWIIGYLSKK